MIQLMQLDQAPKTFLASLPDGPAGTQLTLQLMGQLVRTFKAHPAIRQAAQILTANVPQKDFAGEVRALFEYVRDQIRYVRDTRGVETIQTPLVTQSIESGDCDDKSSYLATLLESIGHPTRFVAVGRQPGTYQHVFVQTKIGPQWVSLDATEPHDVGWTPQGLRQVMIHNN